ncbi:MAG: dynamin family protein [Paracoccaceae bacterium]
MSEPTLDGAIDLGTARGGDAAGRRWLPRTGTAIDRLRHAVSQAHAAAGEADATLAETARALDAFAPSIALVGQMKAGKTALANAIVGRPGLLPVSVTPYTAVVTALHLTPGADEERAEFRFFDKAGWQKLAREGGRLGELARRARLDDEEGALAAQVAAMRGRAQDKLGDNFERLLGRAHAFDRVETRLLERYIATADDAEDDKVGKYAEMTREAHLRLGVPDLATRFVLVDTPGVNDPFLAREEATLGALSRVDLCVLVLSAHQALSTVDVALLRLCTALGPERAIVFVNRVDELDDRARARAEIEARLRRVLAANDLAAMPIVFGSAVEGGEGVADLLGALDRLVVEGRPVKARAARLATRAADALRGLVREARVRGGHRRPQLSEGAVVERLDAILRDTEQTLQTLVAGLWQALGATMIVTGVRFAEAEVVKLDQASSRILRRGSWEIDTMPLRRDLMAAYENAFGEARSEIARTLDEAARQLEALHAALLPDAEPMAIVPPVVPDPPAPVALARTLSLDLDAGWWRRLLGGGRSTAELRAKLRHLVQADVAALVEEVRDAHLQPMVDALDAETRALFERERRSLARLLEDASAREAVDAERLAALERSLAALDALDGTGTGTVGAGEAA